MFIRSLVPQTTGGVVKNLRDHKVSIFRANFSREMDLLPAKPEGSEYHQIRLTLGGFQIGKSLKPHTINGIERRVQVIASAFILAQEVVE